jgi:hypothetical protein
MQQFLFEQIRMQIELMRSSCRLIGVVLALCTFAAMANTRAIVLKLTDAVIQKGHLS